MHLEIVQNLETLREWRFFNIYLPASVYDILITYLRSLFTGLSGPTVLWAVALLSWPTAR